MPVNVINHFLDDVRRHGSYSGVCGLGVRLQPMENDRLRQHFHMVSTLVCRYYYHISIILMIVIRVIVILIK